MKLSKLVEILEFFYPKDLAYDWDNVGLLIGDERATVNRAMTCLEITDDVVEEAIERNVDLIVSHHPIIYKPIKNLNFKDPHARLITKIIKSNISVYSMHTNVDISSNGMNDWLAQVLNLKNIQILTPLKAKNYKKVHIECKENSLNDVIKVLKYVGAGQKGSILEEYKLSKKQRHIKKLNNMELDEEVLAVESYVLEENINQLKQKLTGKFNYEVYPIENLSQKFGLGRIGTVKPSSLEQLAETFKELFQLDHVKIVGDRERVIRKVGIVGGSGASELINAKLKGCDVLITGDIGFHDAQAAIAANIALIDPGHNVEIIFNDIMSDFINMFDEVTCIPSEIDTNPFEVI